MPNRARQQEAQAEPEAFFKIRNDGAGVTVSWKMAVGIIGAVAVAAASWANIKADSVAHSAKLDEVIMRQDRLEQKVDKVLQRLPQGRYGDLGLAQSAK